jgi:hypothetical protein
MLPVPGLCGALNYATAYNVIGQDPVGVVMNRVRKFGFQKKSYFSKIYVTISL